MKLIHKVADCDLCKADGETTAATFDEPIHPTGSWANVCDAHHARWTMNHPAGYRLSRDEVNEPTDEQRRQAARRAILAGDFAAFEDAVGDGDFADFI